MGIRPNKGDKIERNYRVDGSTEAQQLINESEHTGNEAGKVFAEIAAQADSASKSASELAGRVKTLERKLASNGAFQVQDGKLAPLGAATWTYWGLGRIYPPAGTYWVEATTGTAVEKRGNETLELNPPGPVTVAEGEFLLLMNMQNGQAVRVSTI